MRVAVDATRRFRGKGIATDDLEQVAYLGLVKAVKGFDPDRGHDFLSFAIPTIRGEVRRHFRDLGWAVRPPRSIQETQSKMIACEAELLQRLGTRRGRATSPPTSASSFDARGRGARRQRLLRAGLAGRTGRRPTTSRSPSGSAATTTGFDLAEARAVLAPMLARLTPRERTIVEMRFFRGCTQSEIGREIGVTQMQVSRLLARLIARMREQLDVTLAA